MRATETDIASKVPIEISTRAASGLQAFFSARETNELVLSFLIFQLFAFPECLYKT